MGSHKTVNVMVVGLTIFGTSFAFGLTSVSVPQVRSNLNDQLYLEEITAPSCSDLLQNNDYSYNWRKSVSTATSEKLTEMIKASNKWFQRSWPDPEFLDSRFDVALSPAFRNRSRYFTVRKTRQFPAHWHQATDPSDEVIGVIGVTWAHTSENGAELLPFQPSLGIKELNDVVTNKKGIRFELRVYGKDPLYNSDVHAWLASAASQLVFDKLGDYPELYDEAVVYLYADAPHERFYRRQGFHVVSGIEPVQYKTYLWKVMSASPKSIESQLVNLKGSRTITGVNQPYPITFPNGTKALAAPNSVIFINGEFATFIFSLNDEYELFPGVFAAKGASVKVYDDRANDITSNHWHMVIGNISRPVFSEKAAVWIPQGSWVKVFDSGDILPEPRPPGFDPGPQ